MDFVIRLAIPLEMLFVNLFLIHQCSQRKYSRLQTHVTMGLFVIILCYISIIISQNAPDYGIGNGLFVFCGVLFFIPIKILYNVRGIKIVTVACFSWVYTFMIFALSVRFGYMLECSWFELPAVVLLLQTILYLITFKGFYSIMKTRFIFVLEQIGTRESYALMWMTMMWFWTVFIVNLTFFYPDIDLFQILSLPTISGCVLSSFRYIYLQVGSTRTIQVLENIAHRDDLTQLRTRAILGKDVDDLITRKMPFHLIFFDLNNLKSVNDRYGHLVGDQYLAFFAYEIKIRIGNRGGFYRISGDEFVCVFSEDGLEEFLVDITMLPEKIPDTQVRFLGFSYGIANFPDNGDTAETLLEYADRQMYEMKRTMKLQPRHATTVPVHIQEQ